MIAVAKMLYTASFQTGGMECAALADSVSGHVHVSDGFKDRVQLPIVSLVVALFQNVTEVPKPVIAHLHPNKPATPSRKDNEATCAAAFTFGMLDMPLVDHWIFGADGSFYSYDLESPGHLVPEARFEVRGDVG